MSVNELTSLVLCGRTGVGKSSIANILTQGDIYRDKPNICEIGNDATGVTRELGDFFNNEFRVFDTSGLGELLSGSVPHNKVIKKMRNYFSENNIPLNYICYVKNNRFTEEDAECFKIFKKIFKGGETNFIIIITNTGSEWANDERNVQYIEDFLGNYPIISVDFPCSEDERYAKVDQEIRNENKEHLIGKLSELNYKGINLEILSASQDFENDLSSYINFVPVAGSVYQLTASGVYYVSGKPNVARKRLIDGASGLALDIVSGGLLGLGKPVMSAVGLGVNLAGRGGKAIVEYIRK